MQLYNRTQNRCIRISSHRHRPLAFRAYGNRRTARRPVLEHRRAHLSATILSVSLHADSALAGEPVQLTREQAEQAALLLVRGENLLTRLEAGGQIGARSTRAVHIDLTPTIVEIPGRDADSPSNNLGARPTTPRNTNRDTPNVSTPRDTTPNVSNVPDVPDVPTKTKKNKHN